MYASRLHLWLIGLGISVGCIDGVELASAAQFISKECRQLYYGRWLKERPYKAVASAATQRGSKACGFSSNYSSRQAAIDNALQQCRTEARKRKVPAKLCRIREVKSPSQGELPVQSSVSGTGETLTLKKFQTKYVYDDSQMKLRFGAVGRVSCPLRLEPLF
jgi:hypothetical protein